MGGRGPSGMTRRTVSGGMLAAPMIVRGAAAQSDGLSVTWGEDDATPRTYDPRVTSSRHEYQVITQIWGIHLTGVELRLGKWNVPMPVPTTPGLLGSFKLGSRLMQTAWTTWNGCDGLAASSVRPVVIRVDGGLGTADSCVPDAIAAHR